MTDKTGRPNRRRRLVLGGLASGCIGAIIGSGTRPALAAATVERGDVLVFARGDRQGQPVDPSALKPLKPVLARPMTSAGKLREGRDDLITVVRVPAGELDAQFADFAAGDIVAVSAVCTHQGCLVADVGHLGVAKGHLACSCHGSVFDPRRAGKRVAGPAPRDLPTLSIREQAGRLVVMDEFTGSVGPT